MRLINVDPTALIGRTIFYKDQQVWRVDAVSEDGSEILLKSPNGKGKIRKSQLVQCKLYPETHEVQRRYPRLLRSMRYAAILTDSEASSAIVGYLVNGSCDLGSEAVAHFGGSRRVIEHAIRCRHVARRERGGRLSS